MNIGWIGTGVMGKAMLCHVKEGGHTISVYNRSAEKAKDLASQGIHVAQDIAHCVQDCDIVITMVGYPHDVADIYRREDGIFQMAKAGTICIDMTTSSPKLAQELYEEAKGYHMHMLDAPVSGGDAGAKNASLSIMCGGDKAIFDRCLSLFSCMGKSIHYMGEAGSGQHCKAANQIAVAGAVAAMSEAIIYARHTNLDVQAMFDAIKGGAAGSWQIEHTAPRVMHDDFEPGFYVKHFIKDMHIIQDEMKQRQLSLQMLDQVCHMYEQLARDGEGEKGTQALIHIYEKNK